MISVWVISKGYEPDEGGLETYGRALARGYEAVGHKVVVFTQTSAGPRDFASQGVRVVDVGRGGQVVVMMRLLWAIFREIVKGGPPTFFHSVTWRTAIVPMCLSSKPVIISVHGREIMFHTFFSRLLMICTFWRAKALVCVSYATRTRTIELSGRWREKCLVAWNGLSERPRSGQASPRWDGAAEITILTLCRLVARKNVRGALRAVEAAMSRAEGIKIRYIVAGRGPELEALADDAAQSTFSECIEVRGFVADDEVAHLIGAADMFLHPQIELGGGRDFEGFGIAVADAMAAGLACIVGRDGGPAELIEHNECGLVVDGNDLDEVRDAVLSLVKDVALRRRLGDNARKFALSAFSWPNHARRAGEAALR